MLYFRGCTAREKETGIADATEKLLRKFNIDYHILDDENCCGSVLLRTGFEKEAQEQIKKNSELFRNEKILTSCAGCYKTLTEDYDDLDVIHITMLLDELMDNEHSKKDLKATYHDSCHLARHCGVYEEPRNIISSLAKLVEMENIRENGLCCGAGGGVKSAYPEIASQLSKNRINQAKNTGADVLITACPFCKLNLSNDEIEVLDLTEFVLRCLDE